MPLDSVPLTWRRCRASCAGPVLRRLTRHVGQRLGRVRRAGSDHAHGAPPRGRWPADDVGHDAADAGRREPLDDRAHRRRSGRCVRGRPDLRVRADRAVGGDPRRHPVGRPLAAARRRGRRSSLRRRRRPSSSSTTRRAASRTAAAATGWRSRCVDLATRFDAAPPPQPHLLVHVGRPDLRRRGRAPADAARAARRARPRSASTRRTCSARRRRSAGDGPGTRRARLHRRDGQPPVDATASSWRCTCSPGRRCCGPRRCSQFPTSPPIPPDVDPDVSKESWDEDRENVELFRAVLPAGAPRAGERPVADDLRRPRDHRRLEHRSPVGQQRLRQAGADGGRSPTALLAYALCQHWGNKPAAFTTRGLAGAADARRRSRAPSATVAADERRRRRAVRCSASPPAPLPTAPPAQVLRDLTRRRRDPVRPDDRAGRGLAGPHRPAGRAHRPRVPADRQPRRPDLPRRARRAAPAAARPRCRSRSSSPRRRSSAATSSRT